MDMKAQPPDANVDRADLIARLIAGDGDPIDCRNTTLSGVDFSVAVRTFPLDGASSIKCVFVKNLKVAGRVELSEFGRLAKGALSLRFEGCIFDEPVMMDGAHLICLSMERCQLPALLARGIRIVRCATFIDLASVTGVRGAFLSFFRAQIDGSFTVRRCSLECLRGDGHLFDEHEWGKHRTGAGLELGEANIGGSVIMHDDSGKSPQPQCAGVSLNSTVINGALNIDGVRITPNTEQGSNRRHYAIDATYSSVKHELTLKNARIDGPLWLVSARLEGRFDLSDTTMRGLEREQQNVAIDATDVRIEDRLLMWNASIHGQVVLRGAYVGASLQFFGSWICQEQDVPDDRRRFYALDAVHMEVQGSVEFRFNDQSWERRRAWMAQLGLDENWNVKPLTSASLSRLPEAAQSPYVRGGISFAGARIFGDFVWNGLCLDRTVPVAPDRSHPTMLDLRGTEITGRLLATELLIVAPLRLDLTSAKLGELSGNTSLGWDCLGHIFPSQGPRRMSLQLADLCYAGVTLKLAGTDLKADAHECASWLSRACAPTEERAKRPGSFNYQPFHAMAKALSATGDILGARTVLIEAFEQERKTLPWWCPDSLLRLRAFGLCFGYGYQPRNAFFTLVVYWLLGLVLFHSAPQDAFVSTSAASDGQFNCVSFDPAIYALDVMLPILDLQQEARCFITASPELRWWRWGMVFYAVVGWVVTSVAVLTFSGVFRREPE